MREPNEKKSACFGCTSCVIEKGESGSDITMYCEDMNPQFQAEYGCCFFTDANSYEEVYNESEVIHIDNVENLTIY